MAARDRAQRAARVGAAGPGGDRRPRAARPARGPRRRRVRRRRRPSAAQAIPARRARGAATARAARARAARRGGARLRGRRSHAADPTRGRPPAGVAGPAPSRQRQGGSLMPVTDLPRSLDAYRRQLEIAVADYLARRRRRRLRLGAVALLLAVIAVIVNVLPGGAADKRLPAVQPASALERA